MTRREDAFGLGEAALDAGDAGLDGRVDGVAVAQAQHLVEALAPVGRFVFVPVDPLRALGRRRGGRLRRLGHGRLGPGRLGPGRFGPGRFGPGRFGPGRFGPGRFGPGRFGPGRFGLGGRGLARRMPELVLQRDGLADRAGDGVEGLAEQDQLLHALGPRQRAVQPLGHAHSSLGELHQHAAVPRLHVVVRGHGREWNRRLRQKRS
ncbi:hypothetical protein DJ019_19170 [Phenylobacterium kunshanense]|uniref:Uncharacterized protein n=1 Tax=Phenylobacterium kunshanense TaxID=1445034 RepID=A0A328B803_9CAUL|nr:hypothetical protein DJ019_19170 [Phenylobacterium kunshanense]